MLKRCFQKLDCSPRGKLWAFLCLLLSLHVVSQNESCFYPEVPVTSRFYPEVPVTVHTTRLPRFPAEVSVYSRVDSVVKFNATISRVDSVKFVQITMSLIGNIKDFNPAAERLQSYLDRLGSYFRTNKIGILPQNADAAQLQTADQEKVDALISMIGIQAYGVMANACKPDSPAGKGYDALVTVLRSHYVQTKVEIAETFKFHQQMQKKDENIASFVGRLRSTIHAHRHPAIQDPSHWALCLWRT